MWRSSFSRVLRRGGLGITSPRSNPSFKEKALSSPVSQQSKRRGTYLEGAETPARSSLSGIAWSSQESFSEPLPGGDGGLYNPPGPSRLASSSERVEKYNLSLRPSPGKGLGLFTTEDIPKGKILIIERPALVWAPIHEELMKKKQANSEQTWDNIKSDYLQRELDKLPKLKQGEIWSLYNHTENSKEYPLLSIFRTNTFGFSGNESTAGVYIFCSRLNHCCDPNCTWKISKKSESNDPRNRVIRVTAMKDIKAGEELTISYVVRENRVEERQAELLRAYGFQCACPRCVFELCSLERLYSWPFDRQQKVRLRFNPKRPHHTLEGGQGWDFLTSIQYISGEVAAIDTDGIIAREIPLILFTKEEMEKISSLISERFRQLSSSKQKAYLRLYNWKFRALVSETSKEGLWPSYDSGSTDEEEPAGEKDNTGRDGLHMRKRPMPHPENLLNIWTTNSFHFNQGVQGVFSLTSHVEHSCSPSCRLVWCEKQGTLDLVATRPLKVGDEITICYNSDTIFNLTVRERQQYLKENYGFDCSCFRCYIDLSGINTFAPNIDPLPLSEILAAGKRTDYKINRGSHELNELDARDERTQAPLIHGGLKETLQQDQARRRNAPDKVLVAENQSRFEKFLPPSPDSIIGKHIRIDENEKPGEGNRHVSN